MRRMTDLQFGPLDPANAASGIPPSQFGAKRQFGHSQLVGAGLTNFPLDRLPSSLVGRRVQSIKCQQLAEALPNALVHSVIINKQLTSVIEERTHD